MKSLIFFCWYRILQELWRHPENTDGQEDARQDIN